MQEVNNRWYLYVAHLWHRGWSVIDVTDPTAPEYCSFIPGPENTWTIQVQVAEGKMIAGLERIAPGWGGADGHPFTEGFFIFDVSAPTEPKKIGHFQTGSTGTHRNFYDGGNLVHAAAGAPELNRKNLPHRRYRRSGQPTRSRPLFIAGAGTRCSDERT